MKIDTQIKIGGNEFVTDKETALKLYDLLANNVVQFSSYSKDMFNPLIEYNLQLSPLGKDFQDDANAAQALGVTFSEYMRDKQSTTH